MQTRKAPDLWGLHENKTCMFPIKVVSFFSLHIVYYVKCAPSNI